VLFLTPGRLLATGATLLALVAVVLWIAPSDQYLLLPDRADPVAPLVTVKGGRDSADGGGIYFVAAVLRRAKLFEEIFPSIHEGASLIPEEQVDGDRSEQQRRRADLRAMARSQDIAAAVALKELGYNVTVRRIGALISQVATDSPAEGHLESGDVVVGVDGAPVRGLRDLGRLIRLHRPGERVKLSVRTSEGLRSVTLRTTHDPHDRKRAIIGVLAVQAAQVKLPIPVNIDSGSIGGPSAGLAFALDVMEELGRDVDHGHRIAATGELEADGTVLPVGALEQKTIGARRAKVDVFLVPAGDNAREARRHAGGLRIVPVRSFRQALQALATLPPNR
jgi:PDZ domain-containing protein